MQFVKPLTTSVALFLVFAIAFVGCNSSRFPSGELVMFTSIGPHVFQGRVSVVRPDGSSLTTVLNPNASLEYSAAFGNSLKTFIVASAAQSIGGNNFVTNLVQYFPSSGRTIPLQQQLPAGQEGVGVPSPDNSQFVAEIGPPGPQLNLWVSDFKTKQFLQLTDGPTQDFDEAWSSDGRQIVFLRFLPPFPSITTQLMMVSSHGGPATVLLGTSEHVGEAAFSPDGKRLAFTSINGLETMDLTTMQRTVILTLTQLHGSPIQRLTEGVGISWAKTQDKIVLVLRNIATGADELWTVSSDGSSLQQIYANAPGAFITSVTFISN